MSHSRDELRRKEESLAMVLNESGFDGVILSHVENLAWLTCGGSCWVGKDSRLGSIDVLVLNGKKYLIAATNEKRRLMDEEVAGQGYELVEYAWYESKEKVLAPLIRGKKVASDTGLLGTNDIFRNLQRIRFSLLDEEIVRLREWLRRQQMLWGEHAEKSV